MRIALVAVSLSFFVIACGGGSKEPAKGGDVAQQASDPLPTGPDPCGLVSQTEMEALMGPLAEPPFRVDSNRRPKVDGSGCFYRARDRRNVTLDVDWEDGELAFKMLAGTGQAVTDVLAGYDPSTDTLEGAWDKVGSAFGQVIALKGKTSVQVDPVASRIGLAGAAKLAAIAMTRVGKPLDYSGAKATLARKPDPDPTRNPCELVTRAEAESLMGPLKSDPKPSADNSECEFVTTMVMMGYPVTRQLKVGWIDGFHEFGVERLAISGAKKAMEKHIDPDIPTLSQEATKEAEPWDDRITLMGMQITVVKKDVVMQATGEGVSGFDESKALQLLRIAARRL